MRTFRYSGFLIGLAVFAAGASAQETQEPQQNAQPPAAAQPPQPSPTATCIADPPGGQQTETRGQGAEKKAQQQGEKPSVAKDVGSAAGGTAGQIAGAAVGGPIGAAAVGVVGERVGRAIGSVVKGDKKKMQRKEAEHGATGTPSVKCVAEAPVQQPDL